jgi:hypothetical protein
VAEICQNRTAEKDRFFGGPHVAQIKKWKTNTSLEITWGMCTRNRRSKRYYENFHKLLRAAHKSISRQQLPQILPSSN